ncbi:MAG: MFS transporter [Deltaproteobacteria bacterium]|nr:MFS transporter [Deltaproteobacteria bacterium]
MSAPSRSPSEPSDGPVAALRSLGPHTGLFALLCLATFFEGFDTKLASFVQPVIATEYEAGIAEVGTAIGITSFGMVLAFFVNLLADVVGRRPVFLGALVVYAAFTLATAFAPDLATFTALQFFARMAMVVELFLAYLILSEEVPPRIRGRVNGFFASTATLGAAVPAGLLAPLDAIGVGWRGLFVIGAFPLLLLPIYFRRIPETRAFRERPITGTRYGEEFLRIAAALWGSRDRARLVRVSLLWLAINGWAGSAMYLFFQYAMSERGWTAEDVQLLPLGTIPLGLALYAASGFVMDRFGRRPAATLYLAACFVTTVVCYQATNDRAVYWAYCTLFGLNGVWVVVTTWTLELFPTASRSTALAIANNLVGRMGLVFGPMLGGVMAERWESLSFAVVSLASVTLFAIPIVWTLPETNGIVLSEDAPEP